MAVQIADKSYLGQGWNFPFQFSTSGGVSQVAYEDKIKLNIIVLLSTEPGTRMFEPDYGCALRKFIYEPDDFITYEAMKREIVSALSRWVSVIQIEDISINFSEKKDNFVPLKITYSISGVNTVFNLVYPFYRPDSNI